jgi:hypothetical protein
MKKLKLCLSDDMFNNIGRQGHIMGQAGNVKWKVVTSLRGSDHKQYYLMEHPETKARQFVMAGMLTNFY